MRHAASRFAAQGCAWIPEPPLGDLVPTALSLFREMLTLLPRDRVQNNDFHWDSGTTPEPDDGIIVKGSRRTDDPTAQRTGCMPDNKIYIHVRPRTEDMFKERGVWRPEFAAFFGATDEIHRCINDHMEDFFAQLAEVRPDIGFLKRKREECVLRLMIYEEQRNDGSGLVGKRHTDRCDGTLHLYDSSPGLLVYDAQGQGQLVPRRSGKTLWFAGDRMQQLTSSTEKPILALPHGASHPHPEEGRRQVAVFFLHNWHPHELAHASHAAK